MLSKFAIGVISLGAVSSAAALAMWLEDGGPGLSARIPGGAPLSSAFEASEDFQFDPPPPGSYTLHKIKPAPDGQVIDHTGNAQSLRALTKGKISLVSFVYLNCSDVNGCPLAMSTLFDLYNGSIKLPGLRADVQLVTISFDPERDTVAALDSFAHPIMSDTEAGEKLNWHVLTTSGQDALQPILDGYGQVVDRSNDQEQLNHLLRLFLVDEAGNIRNIYGLGQIDPRLLMTDIETLLIEKGRG